MTSRRTPSRSRAVAGLAAGGAAAVLVGAGLGVSPAAAATSAPVVPAGYTSSVFASVPGSTTGPDDITSLDGHLFVGFQNGVGSKGEPAPSGQTKSTVVEFDSKGATVAHWDLTGKVDGLTADPDHKRIVATVNEDANSSLYTVTPGAAAADQVKHFSYSPNPLPHGGGTDSITVADGQLFVVASAPAADAKGNNTGPALYHVTLDGSTATATSVFQDNATATDAVTGKPTTLNLSDPDSSELMPNAGERFAGDFLLDSQGDKQLVFLKDDGRGMNEGHAPATVLNISTQIDDSAVATSDKGVLYVTDSKGNTVDAICGGFKEGQMFVSVPSDSDTLASTLGTVDLKTGTITSFATGIANPKGELFVPGAACPGSTTGSTSSSAGKPASGASAGIGTGAGSGGAVVADAASSTPLANTGVANVWPMVGIGSAILIAGIGLVLFVRRRQA